MKNKTELVLGTAQWGSKYGITNKTGKISSLEISKIFKYCIKNKIRILDTARDYGKSEKIIGEFNKKNSIKIKTISKIKNFGFLNKNFDKKKIKELILKSNRNILQDSIEGMLIHDDNLIKNKYFTDLWDILLELKKEKKIKKIGISTYKNNIDKKIIQKYKFDIVQLPFNIYDQSRSENGFLKKLKDNNVEIHARSVFLQGIILQNYKSLSGIFSVIKEHQKKMHHFFESQGITIIEGCLRAILQNQNISKVIVGCDNVLQLEEIHHKFLKIKNSNQNIRLKKFAINNKKIINPSLWK